MDKKHILEVPAWRIGFTTMGKEVFSNALYDKPRTSKFGIFHIFTTFSLVFGVFFISFIYYNVNKNTILEI